MVQEPVSVEAPKRQNDEEDIQPVTFLRPPVGPPVAPVPVIPPIGVMESVLPRELSLVPVGNLSILGSGSPPLKISESRVPTGKTQAPDDAAFILPPKKWSASFLAEEEGDISSDATSHPRERSKKQGEFAPSSQASRSSERINLFWNSGDLNS